MRFQQWLAPVLGLTLVASTGRTVVAQYGPPGSEPQMNSGVYAPGYAGSGVPGGGYPGGGYPAPLTGDMSADPYGGPVPPPPGFYNAPPVTPPRALAWPTTSPFEHQFSEHRVEQDGLWYHTFNNRGREWFGRFDYIHSQFKRPEGIVGQPGAQTFLEASYQTIIDSGTAFDPTIFNPVVVDAFRDPLGFTIPTFAEQGSQFNYFNAVRGSETGQVSTDGIRVTIGFTDPDNSGITGQGWYTGRDSSTYDARDEFLRNRNEALIRPSVTELLLTDNRLLVVGGGDAFGPDLSSLDLNLDPLTFDDATNILSQQLGVLNGLPIADQFFRVFPDGSVVGGTTVPYDLEFKIKSTNEAAGATVDFVTNRFIDKKYFHMQGVIGGRYVYLREGFGFLGRDSGLAYDDAAPTDPVYPLIKAASLTNGLDDDGDGLVDPVGIIEDTTGGGGTATATRFIRLDTLAQLFGIYHPGAYTAYLNNESESNMFGPEVGLQYDLGGKHLRLWGQSKFGLLINHEQVRLQGDNIGQANDIGSNIDPVALTADFLRDSPLLQPTVDNPFPNAFQDSQSHTHVSPMFEQSLNADIPLIQYIPLINKIGFLDEATFNAGVNFLYIGQVARPSESVRWQGNPRAGLFPSIELKRSDWHVLSYNFGFTVPF